MCPVCFSTIKTTKSLELIFPHLNSLALTVNICFIFLFFFVYFFYCRLFLWLASLGGWFEKVLSLSWWISLLRRQRKMLICTSSMTTCCFHYQRSKNNHAVLWMHSNPSQGIKHLSHYHLVHPVTLISTVLCRHLFSNQYFLPLSHFFCDFFFSLAVCRGGRFTVIDHCPVSELRVENCRVKLHSLQKNLFRLYMAQKSLLLRTDAP